MIEPRRGAGHSAGASCVGVAALQAGHHRADRRRHEARTSLRRSRIRERETFHRRDYRTRGAVRIACSRWFRLSLFPGGHRCCERPAFFLPGVDFCDAAAYRRYRVTRPSIFHLRPRARAQSRPRYSTSQRTRRRHPRLRSSPAAGFWGVFQHVVGVTSALCSYAGGTADTAHYEMVGTNTTGHVESVRVTFRPPSHKVWPHPADLFSVAHNPTELNHQGPDLEIQ